jgi:hypothetical protein
MENLFRLLYVYMYFFDSFDLPGSGLAVIFLTTDYYNAYSV